MHGLMNIRKKVQRRRIETVLLAGYALAVTCALFVSLLNKGKTVSEEKEDSEYYDFNSDVMMPAFSDSAKNNPFELLYVQVNNLKLLSDDIDGKQGYNISQNGKSVSVNNEIEQSIGSGDEGSYEGIYQKEHRILIVSPGDNFIGLLTGMGMDNKRAVNAYNTLKKVYDARNLRIGQHIELTATFDVKSNELETLDSLVIEPVRGTRYILKINEYDQFVAKVEQEKFASEMRDISGVINGYVSSALNKAGVPYKLCGKVTQMFNHIIDFRRDIKKGDKFRVKYEVSKDKNGEVVSVGDVIYASFTLRGHTYKLYRFKNRNGEVDYYDEKGGAKKSGLDRKPLAMRNARISSLFGYRRHPIFKTTKFHGGVDYAAPKGTAIYASGSGVIEIARYVNGYGNFIKIRHNSEYQTAYGHMYKFAAGMKPGVRVRKGQVIGYVGSTGRSTGPHLHFEIVRKGQRIDPLKARVATGTDLTGRQLAEFKRMVKKVDAELDGKAKKVAKSTANEDNSGGQVATKQKAMAETKVAEEKSVQSETVTKNDNESKSDVAKAEDIKLVYPPERPKRKLASQDFALQKDAPMPTRRPKYQR